MKYGPISFDDTVLKGKPLFTGTSVTVQTLFEYIEDGKTLDRFLTDYPAVNKKQVVEVVQMAKLLITSEDILKVKFTND
jgi:uncharacterized protein (DUF433 family)